MSHDDDLGPRSGLGKVRVWNRNQSASQQQRGFPRIRGPSFRGPYNEDCSILGSMLGYPNLGKLPNSSHLFKAPSPKTLSPKTPKPIGNLVHSAPSGDEG